MTAPRASPSDQCPSAQCWLRASRQGRRRSAAWAWDPAKLLTTTLGLQVAITGPADAPADRSVRKEPRRWRRRYGEARESSDVHATLFCASATAKAVGAQAPPSPRPSPRPAASAVRVLSGAPPPAPSGVHASLGGRGNFLPISSGRCPYAAAHPLAVCQRVPKFPNLPPPAFS